MIKSNIRGHRIYFDNNTWKYLDTNENILFSEERPCARCGKFPTPEGYDACLGFIPCATNACCGHGVSDLYVIMEE